MIKKLTNHILSYLISSNAIDDNEETKDYYRYGIEITISSLINILLIIIIGIVSGNALESMANMACGSASAWGMYQPKEPKKLDKSKK